MKTLLINIGELVTVNANGADYKAGKDMSDIGVIPNGAVLFDDTILWVGTTDYAEQKIIPEYDDLTIVHCKGKCVLPGFVDSHSHIVFAGNRATEFARRLAGVSYQTIANEGGGILSTMRAVRSASVENLAEIGKSLALSALAHGTTTMEVKSGYGLSLSAELNQLEAIRILQHQLPMNIVPTFLGAHDFPPEFAQNRDEYVDVVINEMIPEVAKRNLAVFCDVFTDTGYYTIEQSRRILNAGKEFGLIPKIHADELSSFSAGELAGDIGAISADHLLYVSDQGMQSMKSAGTVATLLPGTAYTLRLPYAPARKMIDNDMIVALATDCNPGSCFTENMQTILSLACSSMKMSIEEAITSSTLNGAKALGLSEKIGSIEVGKQADMIMLDSSNYADLVYHFGVNHISHVWIKGKMVI
jgi:imidazolonepropionase